MKVRLTKEQDSAGCIYEGFFVFCLLFVLGFGCGCSSKTDSLRYGAEEILGKTKGTNVVVETWYLNQMVMGLPVRKVCLKQSATNSEILFIAEKEFQESIPGYPMFVCTNGAEFIQDETRSYVFSLAERRFITNYWTNLVYLGDYKPQR